jgi:hypothetical protein
MKKEVKENKMPNINTGISSEIIFFETAIDYVKTCISGIPCSTPLNNLMPFE